MREPLAIVGMACRVPGAADYRSLWANVEAGSTGMVEVGEQDRLREGVSLDPTVRNKYVPMAAPLDGYDEFDSTAFGISAGEAKGLNLNHRVMMEVVLEALEDAGCDPLRFPRNIGLFAAGGGASPISVMQRVDDAQYGNVARPLKLSEAINWTALLDNDFLATRIAYPLDLRGPCLTVQTACSSSLVALHLACQSVLSGESDMAVAGGVNIELPHRVGYYHQEGSVWSADGYCRPFDRDASGTITGSGAGAIVIRRLGQALADGDAVHAVIRGSAINNDGNRKMGFTAPSVNQQSLVIGAALAAAGVDKRDIGYLEAHGTGTAIGDVVEWTAIERALGAEGVPCGIGATKANLGHLGAAAGVLGLIKAALVLAHGRIPPVANFVELNPRIKPASGRFFVPDRARSWEDAGRLRRAGVSSMGIGGTNAHVVLEQAPVPETPDEPREHVCILPVTAASKSSVEETASRVAEFAAENPHRLRSLAHTMRTGRRVLPHREAVVVARRVDGLATWRTGSRLAKRNHDSALVFPGQAGKVGDLTAAESEIDGFGDLLSEALQCLSAEDRPLVRGLLTGSSETASEPGLTELAVLVRSVTIARSLLADGLRPQSLCGFSLGEIAAGVVGGVFSLTEAAGILSERARILAAAPAGGMIRVRLSAASVAPYLSTDVSLAIAPGGRDCMLSGETAAINAIAAQLRGDGVPCVRVPVAHPFHSVALEDSVAEYAAAWSKVDLRSPSLRLMSPTTGDWLDEETARDPVFWASHLVRTVRFGDAVDRLRANGTDLAYVLDSDAGVTPFVKEAFGADALAMTTGKQAGFDAVSRARLLAAAWSAGQDPVAVPPDETGRGSGSDAPTVLVHAPTYAFGRSSEKEQPLMEKEAESTPDSGRPSSATADRTPVEAPVPALSHADVARIEGGVRQVVAKLVGCTPEELNPSASFIELGYDSFLLIQLADALSAEFQTDIDVRLLFVDLDSCDGVGEHLKGVVSPSVLSVAAAGDPVPSRTPEPVPSAVPEPLRTPEPVPTAVPEPRPAPLPAPVPRQSGQVVPADGTDPLQAEAEWARRTPLSKRITEEDRFALADQRNLMASRSGRREVSYPVVGVRGDGARFVDVDGQEFIDLCMGFGVIMLGHASEPLTAALRTFEPSDLLIGPQSSTAGDVARGIASLVGVDRVAFTSSGTEAVMGAVRTARAKTGRDVIALFSGSYHGTFDGVLVAPRAGGERGETTRLGRGTPASMVQDVIVLPYDDSAIPILESYGERLAAVLVEPVQSRRPGYQPVELLHRLRALTEAQGAALIFDEIITGFRCHPGGAAAYFGVRPDLVTYGKVIGGGMPIGVIAGDAEFMAPIDGGRWREGDVGFPQRPSMVFAGTFSKHPLTMTVAQQMIWHFKKESPRLQATLTDRTADLARRINAHAAANGFPIEVEHFSSLFRINVDGSPLSEDMFFLGLLNRGIYVWEGRTCFLSAAHTDADCSHIVEAVAETAAEVASRGLWDKARTANAPTPARKPSPAREPSAVVGEAPLTDGQKLLWMASELGGELGASYQMSEVLCIEGTLDPDRLRHAVERVAQRHEAMRIGFDEDGVSQNCAASAVPTLTVSSLSDASPGDVEALLNRFVLRPTEMSAPSLFRFHLVQTNEAAFLQATAPHAIVDGWSFNVLWSELSACYTGGEVGNALPEPAGFLEYARWKRGHEDAQIKANDTLWRSRLDAAWGSARLIDGAGPWKPVTRVDSLPPESLAGLRDLARSSGCTMHTAGLAALAVASSLLTGATQAVIMAHQTAQPRHTRKPLMGFGVDLLPVIIELPDDSTLVDVAKAVQAQILDSSEATSGLYRVLQDKRYRLLPAALTAFNYEDQDLGTMFGAAASSVVLPRATMPWPANVTIEEHGDRIELISEISEFSDLAPSAPQLAGRLEHVLSAPARPLEELRRP
ncbi:aminotransferase class III-fold pyridoxal phosphate-dependent enzyme [Streptomyces scopuliridis]|uniref:Aminotransferase class III-fold pyridoxal phosphate-dependent enzyme n=1 Tax=Streptomyces scopuliridis TaxID=452529 RepID=A0ACD4ZC98_9ACTN|nr:aminotransferase class III-fold pyridoxal phosphate-dependent enzyme [Streptomyces scopuliridis]WSB95764.1 aminotransferase class III-fold pyridoxal phosphate-dependent enzyme [Streptomyces scopuliridis]WSC10529.1 aminotransferase class III-fold pyridoxal phosphate-dependent enzyme [Streptomyces scopuliridis]